MCVTYVFGFIGAGLIAAILAAFADTTILEVITASLTGGSLYMFLVALYVSFVRKLDAKGKCRKAPNFNGFKFQRARQY